jgi:SNF2 family DNA or RNA helicase
MLLKNIQEPFDVRKSKIRFDKIHWKRIVLDEGHEFLMERNSGTEKLKKKKKNTYINDDLPLSSTYRWYVTGTPVPENMKSVRTALRFLGLNITSFDRMQDGLETLFNQKDDHGKRLVTSYKIFDNPFFMSGKDEDELELTEPSYLKYKKLTSFGNHGFTDSKKSENSVRYINWITTKVEKMLETWLWTRLLWRNTKRGVELDKLLPQIDEQTMILEFSDVEMQVYKDMEHDGASDLDLQQLCAHPQVCEKFLQMLAKQNPNGKSHLVLLTMEQIKGRMIDSYEKRIDDIKDEKENIQAVVASNQELMKEMDKIIDEEKKLIKENSKKVEDYASDKECKKIPFSSAKAHELWREISRPSGINIIRVAHRKWVIDNWNILNDKDHVGYNKQVKERFLSLVAESGYHADLYLAFQLGKSHLKFSNESEQEITREIENRSHTTKVIEENMESKKQIQESIRKLELDHKHLDEEFSTIKSKLIYFNTLLPILNGEAGDKEMQCMICLDQIGEQIAITSCGHYFDPICIDQWINVKAECPTCKTGIATNTVFKASFPKKNETDGKSENINTEEIMHKLKDKYGTKMAYIMFFIKYKLPEIDADGKVIIFSQFDGMLTKTCETLQENGIKSVICKGNASQKQKNIERFQKDPEYKVILLSINHCASGTNLPQGNWIFLLDPIIDTVEQVRALEKQAINRAHRQGQTKVVHVVRLVIKNTLEENIVQLTVTSAEEMKGIPKDQITRFVRDRKDISKKTPHQRASSSFDSSTMRVTIQGKKEKKTYTFS